jgi:hypothetical protein
MRHFSRFQLLAAWWLLGLTGLLASQPATVLAQSKSPKRGLAYDFKSAADLTVMAPGISWWYGWNSTPSTTVAGTYTGLGAEYVPMQWDEVLDGTTVTADKLAAKIPAGAKYLLGFNEPNFQSQASLTPKQAAALWPVLEEVARRKGLKLVSPALNYCGQCVSDNGVTYYSPTQWLDAFFAAYPAAQVDYIAMHTYVCEERYLRDKVAELKKYNKPIWLTEFSCGDMDHSQITLVTQQKYLTDALNYLENDPAIFRYSWFSGRNSEIPNINLLGADGQLTALGQLYVNQPYTGSPLLANRLTPASATASSTEKAEVAPAKVIDGDILSRWASAWSDAQYLQVDYGTVKNIAHVRIAWEAGYAADYELQTSSDGNAWTTFKTVVGSDGGVDDYTGLTASGRFLRVKCNRRATSYGYSIWELNAYGAASTTPTPTPTPTPTSTLIQAESYSSMSGVGLETTSDTGGGQNVGWIDTGDKMTYNSVNFPTTGTYTIEYRITSPSGGSLAADLSGTALGTTVAIPATGGWQNWQTVSQTVSVTADTYNLGIRAVAGGWNFNWLRITSSNATARTVNPKLTTSTATTDAELEVYPNPATDQLLLRSAHNLAGSRYQILNALGQVVASGTAEGGSLNVSALPTGMYTLLLKADSTQLSSRFVK